MIKRIIILSVFAVTFMSAMSQPGSGKRNTAVAVKDIAGFRLPASLDNLSLFDGMLHFVAGNMLVTSPADGALLSSPVVDTFAVTIDPELTYAILDQFSGMVYYTKNDSKGVSQLYVYYEKKPGKFASRRVKLSGLSSSVFHPVFTPDGRAMVFVSDSPLGFGGTDLWFSLRNGDEWLSPQNMGRFVNSGGNEMMPSLYGDYLVFSSNGRDDSYGGYDLYASRLVALTQGDTVMMYPIGRSPAYSLQAPFCTEDDDLALVASKDLGSGWWLRRAADGKEEMHYFNGRLECVEMQGNVTSSLYSKLDDAVVVVAHTPRPGAPLVYDTVPVLSDGSYTLYLRPGVNYDLSFHAANHYVSRMHKELSRSSEERLYAHERNDVRLDGVALDSLIAYPNLFSTSVSSELSAAGRKHVDSLALFLIENPALRIDIYSNYNLSADIPFCSLLNASRLRALTDYLVSKGVDAKSIVGYSSRPKSVKRSSKGTGDYKQSPVALSSLTVGFVISNFSSH